MAESGGVKRRRMVIRVLAVLALAAVGLLMYKIGKEFDVVLDNGAVTIDGISYVAMDYGTVTIDKDEKKAFDMWAGDRVIKKMIGARHSLTIKIINEDDDTVLRTVEREIDLSFDTRADMLSLAAITEGAVNIRTPNPRYSPEPVIIPEEKPAETEIPAEEAIIPGEGF
jgi:hypothetical protein